MSTSYPCDNIDCIAHPDYKEKSEIKAPVYTSQISDTYNGARSNGYANFSAISSSTVNFSDLLTIDEKEGIKFKIKNHSISIECLMCNRFERLDMKKELVAYKAKEMLKGESNDTR